MKKVWKNIQLRFTLMTLGVGVTFVGLIFPTDTYLALQKAFAAKYLGVTPSELP